MSKRSPKTALMPRPNPAVDAGIALRRLANTMAAQFTPLFESGEVTDQQFNVLRILYVREGEHGVPCHEIGARLIQRVPDVTRLLLSLEKKGLIERLRCPKDRRVVRSALTSKGQDVVEKLHGPIVEKHAALVAHMSPAEIRELLRLLKKLGAPLGVEVEPGGIK